MSKIESEVERKIVKLLFVVDRFAHEKGIDVIVSAEQLGNATANLPAIWWDVVAQTAHVSTVQDSEKLAVIRLIRRRVIKPLASGGPRAPERASLKMHG